MNTDKNIPKIGSSATQMLEESSQLTANLEDITLNAGHKRNMSPKPRNPQIIIGQMELARILSSDATISDEVDDASLLLAEQNVSSPLTMLHQNVSSVFENAQIKPPTALQELKKHRGLIDKLSELSTSSGSSQATGPTAVKRSSEIDQEDTADNLSQADALAFISGSCAKQNVDGAKPTAEQSIHPAKDQSPKKPNQNVKASAVPDENNGAEGVQVKNDHNSSTVAGKDNMKTGAGTNSPSVNENKCNKTKQVTNKPSDSQVKSVCRKIFGVSNGDTKVES